MCCAQVSTHNVPTCFQSRNVPELLILFHTSISQGSSTEIPIEPRWFKASWKCYFPLYLFFWERWSRGAVNPVKLLQECHSLLLKGLLSGPKIMHMQTLVKTECVCCTQGTLLKLVAILEGNLIIFFKKQALFSFFSFSVKWRIFLEDYHELVNRHWNKAQDIWVPFPALFAARFSPISFQLSLPLLV